MATISLYHRESPDERTLTEQIRNVDNEYERIKHDRKVFNDTVQAVFNQRLHAIQCLGENYLRDLRDDAGLATRIDTERLQHITDYQQKKRSEHARQEVAMWFPSIIQRSSALARSHLLAGEKDEPFNSEAAYIYYLAGIYGEIKVPEVASTRGRLSQHFAPIYRTVGSNLMIDSGYENSSSCGSLNVISVTGAPMSGKTNLARSLAENAVKATGSTASIATFGHLKEMTRRVLQTLRDADLNSQIETLLEELDQRSEICLFYEIYGDSLTVTCSHTHMTLLLSGTACGMETPITLNQTMAMLEDFAHCDEYDRRCAKIFALVALGAAVKGSEQFLIIDGFPLTLNQLQDFEEMLSGADIDAILNARAPPPSAVGTALSTVSELSLHMLSILRPDSESCLPPPQPRTLSALLGLVFLDYPDKEFLHRIHGQVVTSEGTTHVSLLPVNMPLREISHIRVLPASMGAVDGIVKWSQVRHELPRFFARPGDHRFGGPPSPSSRTSSITSLMQSDAFSSAVDDLCANVIYPTTRFITHRALPLEAVLLDAQAAAELPDALSIWPSIAQNMATPRLLPELGQDTVYSSEEYEISESSISEPAPVTLITAPLTLMESVSDSVSDCERIAVEHKTSTKQALEQLRGLLDQQLQQWLEGANELIVQLKQPLTALDDSLGHLIECYSALPVRLRSDTSFINEAAEQIAILSGQMAKTLESWYQEALTRLQTLVSTPGPAGLADVNGIQANMQAMEVQLCVSRMRFVLSLAVNAVGLSKETLNAVLAGFPLEPPADTKTTQAKPTQKKGDTIPQYLTAAPQHPQIARIHQALAAAYLGPAETRPCFTEEVSDLLESIYSSTVQRLLFIDKIAQSVTESLQARRQNIIKRLSILLYGSYHSRVYNTNAVLKMVAEAIKQHKLLHQLPSLAPLTLEALSPNLDDFVQGEAEQSLPEEAQLPPMHATNVPCKAYTIAGTSSISLPFSETTEQSYRSFWSC